VIAYKFLRTGRVGPFSHFQWPEPGVWIRPAQELETCRTGVHACRVQDLPWWLADELWEIELDGDIRNEEHKIVAPAGCLRSRVESWTAETAQDYANACAWRAHARAVEALMRAGHEHSAHELAASTTLDEALSQARRLAERIPQARISLTIAGDGAVRALTGAPPTSAYIAAHAAMRLDGATGYASERAWQSRWLVQRLGLT
jgi:hypothetical protein